MVDEEIAGLILKLWGLGFVTKASCQSLFPPGYVWIQFNSRSDAERFTAIVEGEEWRPQSPGNRTLPDGGVLYSRAIVGWVRDTSQSFSVRFPRDDLAEVEQLL